MPAKSSHGDRRFLVTELGAAGDEAILPPDEAHHLTRVLRLGAGDRVVVFDGRGREFLAEVARAARGHAAVTLLAPAVPAAEPRVPFTVAQAVLKGPAMDAAVRDATMIGAAAIEPIVTRHVDARLPALSRPATMERWRRIALASAKQCRRAVVPAIGAPRPFGEWLRDARHELTLVLVEPSAGAGAIPFRDALRGGTPASAALVVGPEGGWEQAEIEEAAAAGCVPVTLGSLTLRADAVALVAGTLFRTLVGD